MNQNLIKAVDLFRPSQRLTISQWADRHAYIPREENAEPGKFRLSRMPHEAAMLDDPIDPAVRESYWMLASQAGGKTCCMNLICEYAISALHRSIIMVRATRQTAVEWMRDKFLPMAMATPAMDGMLKNPRQRDSGSTSLNRRFPGGSLKAVGAKSPASFRSSSAGIILQDEIDSYVSIKEGDPCALADRAAITFTDSWKVKASTPTLTGMSRIVEGYERGDKQKFFLPCPVCGGFQDLKSTQLKFSFTAEEHARLLDPLFSPSNSTWDIGEFPVRDTRRAVYVCEFCRKGWTDQMRVAAYKSGHQDNPAVQLNGAALRAGWRPTSAFTGIRSRHLNGMYLTIGLEKGYANYLHQFAENFLKAKHGGRETLMVHTNIFEAMPYEDASEKTDWKKICERAEDYVAWLALPAQVVWINFGMDVHPDRVEILFYGWGSKREAWCLQRHVEYGDLDLESMQRRVWEYLDTKRFPHPVLGDMAWDSGFVDSGHQTKVQAVYRFCGQHRLRNIWSCKGFDDLSGETVQMKPERRFFGKRANLNNDYFKSTIFDRLQNEEPGESFIHFPKAEVRGVKTGFTDKFYLQLCSEKKTAVKLPLGGYKTVWMKLSSATRNEVLDCTVYAFANWETCGREEYIERKWKEVVVKLAPKAETATPAEITPPAEIKRPELRNAPQPRPRRVRINSPFAFGRF